MTRPACTGTLNDCQGLIPIVVEAHSADVIATLILLKKEVQQKTGSTIKMTIVGATEAHLLVKEIAKANIGIIFKPSRPFPAVWEQRRVYVHHPATPAPGLARLRYLTSYVHRLPGPPLSEETEIALFLAHNITVGIGIEEAWSARNTRFDVGWVRVLIILPLAPRSSPPQKLTGPHVGGVGSRWPYLEDPGSSASFDEPRSATWR
jgi:hypothetical protein